MDSLHLLTPSFVLGSLGVEAHVCQTQSQPHPEMHVSTGPNHLLCNRSERWAKIYQEGGFRLGFPLQSLLSVEMCVE